MPGVRAAVRCLLCLWALAVPVMLRAQAGSGEITGEIRDPSGGVVAGAPVTLTAVQTHQDISSHSTEGGIFVYSHLRPGEYTLAVEAAGFKRLERLQILVTTGERVRVDVQLELGSTAESVVVTAQTPVLRTESATVGQVIDNQTVVTLPLNGRAFTSLAGLAAGVALPAGSTLPRLSGSRPRTNEYLYDGISVLQPEPGQVAFSPIIDAIQEFNLQTNSASAEFGRFNGGVVNLTTKSGTNQLHGSVFEFLRNEALNARNLFAPATAASPEKPRFRRQQFGGVAGGPIRRDRSFFFVDYQGTRQQVGRVVTSTVPTQAQRNGDFSALLGLPLCRTPNAAVTTDCSAPNTPIKATDTNGVPLQARQGMIFRPSDRLAYPGNQIPVAAFDPVAAALLNLYPLPTIPGAANNFTRWGIETNSQNQFDVRVDHRFSARGQIFGRYSWARDFSQPLTPLPDGYGNLTGAASTGPQNTLGQAFASSYLHTFSPVLTNQVRVGYTRRAVSRRGPLLGETASQALEIHGLPGNAAFGDALPTFVVTGLQQLGPPANVNSDFRTDVLELADTVSYIRGRHAVRFGVDNRISRLDVIQPPYPTGAFSFNGLFTDFPGVAGTGSPLAGFLLGQVQSFSLDLQYQALRPRAWFQEWFIQDNWKLTGHLTLTGGIRYTLNFPSTEVDNQGAVFNLATQDYDYLGQNGFPRSARSLHFGNFGPRLGFAYMLTEKTVVRSGFGVVFFDQSGITTPFTNPAYPFVQTVSQASLNNTSPAFILSAGPTVRPITATADAGLGQSVYTADRSLASGYVQQWNLAVQRQMTRAMNFEIAYVGSKITHLGVPDYNLNQLTTGQLTMGASLLEQVPNPFAGQIPSNPQLNGPTIARAQLLKPFPRFQNVIPYRNNIGNSSYHALQAKLEQRFSNGLTFLVSYTHSKLIDDASSVFDASIGLGSVAGLPLADAFNRRLDRDVSSGDIPNVTAISYTYQLPVGSGHRLNPAGIIGSFTRDWQIAGIVSLQSGLPLAVAQITNFNSFAGFATQRPSCAGSTELPSSERSVARFFNTATMQATPQFSMGTCTRNAVRGPAYRGADLAVIKRIPFREQVSVDLRAEIFNLTNTPPLGAPNTTVGNAAFGRIASARDPRVIQLALKLNF